MIGIRSLDHFALTVADVEATATSMPGLRMEVVVFGLGRRALGFGEETINLHQQEAKFEPKAQDPRRDRPISTC